MTLVLIVLLLILGSVSLVKIPLQLIPDIDPPVAAVITSYDGASPIEVLEKVTKPLEQTLSTLPGLKNITTTSSEGASLIILEFTWATAISEIENDIITRINQTPVPNEASRPSFLKFDPTVFPIIQLSVSSKDEEVRTFQEKVQTLQNELVKIEGVANIDIAGTLIDEVQITLDVSQLEKYRLSQDDVVAIIRANNVTLPGGQVISDQQQLSTRVISQLTTIDDIKDLIVSTNPLTREDVALADIAEVAIAQQKTTSYTRTNQQPSILLNVLQQSDSNTATVSHEFMDKLTEVKKEKEYKDLQIVSLFDQGEFVTDAINNVAISLVVGGILAMVVLFIFLQNGKSPLIIGFAIPFSVIVTFILLYFSDFTLNIMTLGGLALGIGMLVDNAIVVIENIYRHLEMGKSAKEAAGDGATEVTGAITASTLTTISVFLPVVFVSGITGNLFKELALTVSFSLLASLLVALTIVPMFASKFLRSNGKNIESKRQQARSLRLIESLSRWSLRNRAIVLITAVVLFVVGAYGLTTVGTEFMPVTDEGYFTINVKLEPGSSLKKTNDVVSTIETSLEKYNEIEDYVSTIGNPGGEGAFGGTKGNNTAQIYVNMVDNKKRKMSTQAFVESIKNGIEHLDKRAEIKVNIRASFSMGGAPNALEFNVSDSNAQHLKETAAKITEHLSNLDHVVELKSDLTSKQPEIQIVIDRKKALDQGFQPAGVAQMIDHATRGVLATQFVSEEDKVLGVRVTYKNEVTDSIDQLKQLKLKKMDQTYVALGSITTITEGESPVSVSRINQQETIHFTIQYATTTNLGEFTKKVKNKLQSLHLPPETEIDYTGDRELLEDSFRDLGLALALSIVFVYLVMSAQFESLKYPFVIMFTMPLVVIGSALALMISNTPIGVTAFIGFLVLAGIVVNNAIILVDYINKRKEEGLSSIEAIIESTKIRIRPILMTSLTTILGLIPLALGFGEGTELQKPLGITVIGGLISSTFLTLFVIPVVYSLFDRETRKRSEQVK